jgi:hypothetical protein
MSALDARIDELYQLPPSEFTAARNALAKTVMGADAARVKHLAKPSIVPWTVNQLYWRERRTYDRVMAAGRALRAAQIATLKGRAADLRAATTEHRAAVADAIATATQLAAQAGVHPAAEPLSRMIEALSLAPEPPDGPGRFTELLQPAGYEALAGVTPAARPRTAEPEEPRHATGRRSAAPAHEHADKKKPDTATRAELAEARRRAEAEAAARKAAQAALHAAQRRLERARAAEARVSAHAETIRQQLAHADAALRDAQAEVREAQGEVDRAETAMKSL